MDFMTQLPYWGIVLIIAFNAIWVARKDISVMEDSENS